MVIRADASSPASRPFHPDLSARVKLSVSGSVPAGATAVGAAARAGDGPPKNLGLSRERMRAVGFDGSCGKALLMPQADGSLLVAAGVGADALEPSRVRDAAAAFALAVPAQTQLVFSLEGLEALPAEAAAQAAVEGILLARYEFAGFGRKQKGQPVQEITLVATAENEAAVRSGAERGRTYAEATILARDLANTPHSHLTATLLGQLATELGKARGFEVEVFDKAALKKLGCGGLLGVNAGSVEPPCMIKLVYRPAGKSNGSMAVVGKGIMYDSGGISLKSNDNIHARMKNDMSGAAAVLAAVSQLRELGCGTTVTSYLMCTDNMPSGTAQALGDVITTYGGRTVEVTNTDAEGRLVMCDALALAAEEGHDAIFDIATLTGSVMRALGTEMAGLFGNSAALIEQVKRAAEATGEPVWQLPLHSSYRKVLDSDVAYMRNAGPTGGAQPDGIVAALYLSEFVGDVPWAHIDICGTAWHDRDELWHRAGCSGFGARLLLELATRFQSQGPAARH